MLLLDTLIMSKRAKRQRNGESDNSSDEMVNFTQENFSQQRHLIFEKLLSIENNNKETINKLLEEVELLKQKVTVLEKENVYLKREINSANQSILSDSIIIYGVPKSDQISDITVFSQKH